MPVKKNQNMAKNDSIITCSKIPLFCRSVCDSNKKLYFDENLKRISAFSFGSYKIRQSLDLNFKITLKQIDSDAFNGLIIGSDAVLKLNIGLDEDDFDYQYSDDDQDIEPKQIEYDLEVASTKSDPLMSNQVEDIIKRIVISSNAFRGLIVKPGGRLVLNIKNYNRVEFDSSSFNNIKQYSNSGFMIFVENCDLVLLKSQCGKGWKAFNENDIESDYEDNIYDYNDPLQKLSKTKKKENEIESVFFKLNFNSINKIVFEKESFSNMRLFNSSTFQIVINKFNHVLLGRSTFSQIIQQRFSNFELNLSAGKRLTLSEELFSNLVQLERSKFVIYFGINESNICIKKNAFAHLSQSMYSTLRVTFLMNQINSLFFKKEVFYFVKQELNSYIQIYVLRANEFLLDSESVSGFEQGKLSTFEIWLSKSKSNFTIRQSAFKNVKQGKESSIKIGFTSSANSFYIQSPNAFVQFESASNSEVSYDFSYGKKFLNFALFLINN